MTEEQFHEAMLRGQGRCILAAKANPDRYRSEVLWACSHEIAYDPQCEGTRSWLLSSLIDCYEDKNSFVNALTESLELSRSNGGWEILYLAEVLRNLSNDGDNMAKVALWRKYEKLYERLSMITERPEGIFFECEDFSMLCQVLGETKEGMIRIAEDIGRLYCEKKTVDARDFDWLFDTHGEQFRRTLIWYAKKSENIDAFIRRGLDNIQARNKCMKDPNRKRTGIALSSWLKHKADQKTVLQYAEEYLKQSDPEARADALKAFLLCPFPGDPTPIITDALSDCSNLSDVAWRALENICHPQVREFAAGHLIDYFDAALPVFITNYQPGDDDQLFKLITAVPVDFECTTAWHSFHHDVLRMQDQGNKAPAQVLRYIYENTYCSFCREHTLHQMAKRRLLEDSDLEECLFDSYDDTRAYARRLLNRRKRYAIRTK